MRKTILFALLALTLCACSNKNKKDINALIEEFDTETSGQASDLEVPFTESGGVKYVNATINGVGVHDMIFDTGCSQTLISLGEARELFRRGALKESDFTGVEKSVIADGSIVENMGVVLEQVVLGNSVVCHNVKATISNSINAPLLLGNEVNDRASSVTIDNERKVIIFKP